MEINKLFLYFAFIIAGLFIGSFLNVVIYRVPRKKSVVKPSSFCPVCKKKIAFYDNIPLISYAILKGKCRNCKSRISFIYPLVEFLTAILFLTNYVLFGLSVKAILGIILCSLLVAVSFIDINFRIIPNAIVLPFTVLGLAVNIISNISSWWMPLVFSIGAFLFMLIIHLIYPAGMGMGDVKLSLMIGAFLVKNVVAALFLGFLAGSIFGLIFIAAKKKKLKQTMPFGPFISIGSVIALFWGNFILKWYIGFY